MSIGTNSRRANESRAACEYDRLHKLKLLFPTLSLVAGLILMGGAAPEVEQQPDPTPTPDPLATPVMPEFPTQLDIGRNAYYYNCMPCHGDKGQGLTDEWRAVWVEDHQDCWERGCHGGGVDDEGFPIPRFVPAVNGSGQALASFRTSDDLYEYLLRTHPPQRPGALDEVEYRALAEFLLHEAGRLPDEATPDSPTALGRDVLIGGIVLGAIVALTGVWLRRRKYRTGEDEKWI